MGASRQRYSEPDESSGDVSQDLSGSLESSGIPLGVGAAYGNAAVMEQLGLASRASTGVLETATAANSGEFEGAAGMYLSIRDRLRNTAPSPDELGDFAGVAPSYADPSFLAGYLELAQTFDPTRPMASLFPPDSYEASAAALMHETDASLHEIGLALGATAPLGTEWEALPNRRLLVTAQAEDVSLFADFAAGIRANVNALAYGQDVDVEGYVEATLAPKSAEDSIEWFEQRMAEIDEDDCQSEVLKGRYRRFRDASVSSIRLKLALRSQTDPDSYQALNTRVATFLRGEGGDIDSDLVDSDTAIKLLKEGLDWETLALRYEERQGVENPLVAFVEQQRSTWATDLPALIEAEQNDDTKSLLTAMQGLLATSADPCDMKALAMQYTACRYLEESQRGEVLDPAAVQNELCEVALPFLQTASADFDAAMSGGASAMSVEDLEELAGVALSEDKRLAFDQLMAATGSGWLNFSDQTTQGVAAGGRAVGLFLAGMGVAFGVIAATGGGAAPLALAGAISAGGAQLASGKGWDSPEELAGEYGVPVILGGAVGGAAGGLIRTGLVAAGANPLTATLGEAGTDATIGLGSSWLGADVQGKTLSPEDYAVALAMAGVGVAATEGLSSISGELGKTLARLAREESGSTTINYALLGVPDLVKAKWPQFAEALDFIWAEGVAPLEQKLAAGQSDVVRRPNEVQASIDALLAEAGSERAVWESFLDEILPEIQACTLEERRSLFGALRNALAKGRKPVMREFLDDYVQKKDLESNGKGPAPQIDLVARFPELNIAPSGQNAFNKLDAGLQADALAALGAVGAVIRGEDPNAGGLDFHRLKGNGGNTYACRITGNYRIIFARIGDNVRDPKSFRVDTMGSHDAVYRNL